MNSRLSQLWVLIAASAPDALHACERLALPPPTRPTGHSSVSGVVIEHVAREIPEVGDFLATGVLLGVQDSVGSVARGSQLEVFPFVVGLGCEPMALEPDEVKKQYPVGSRVVVTGNVDGDTTPYRLLAVGEFGYLARVPDERPRMPDGCIDFRSYKSFYASNSHPYSFDVGWQNAHRSWYEDYEFLRCLDILDTINDRETRFATLDNLAFYSRYDGSNLKYAERLYKGMLKEHVENTKERRRAIIGFRASRDVD